MCSCDFSDYEMPAFYKEARHIARKVHHCDECNCACILPGEKYLTVSGLWEGHFKVYKTCGACLDMKAYVESKVACFCPSLGDLYSMGCEEIIEARKTPGAMFGFGRLAVARQRRRRFFKMQDAPITTRK
jgi:hypothetical protein